jgi:phthalate 4,5-dioxygenase oxygenase subunit
MTSAAESRILVHTGAETPMGRLMREYWIPACLSSELAADAPPMRLLLLGEKLVAFRDTSGRVGLLDQRCPHRCASLYFGRNEKDGVRCAYHGWKFDVRGNCVEMPNLPARLDYRDKVKAKAYPVVERNGLVWAYMGPRAEAPPLPLFEPTLLDADNVTYRVFQRECNWLQALEGDIDTSHFGFLHAGSVDPGDLDPDEPSRFAILDRAPEYHVAETQWGTTYAAYRPADPGSIFYRVAHFLVPFWTFLPEGVFRDNVIAQAWVPMDDTHTMVYQLAWKKRSPPPRSLKEGRMIPGLEPKYDYLPNTPDWYGRWRFKANKDNDYLLDREAQRTVSFTGITGVSIQDQAITESMGPVTDHSWEHLVPSDRMITATRRRLVKAATALEQGEVPPGVDNPEINLHARAGSFVASEALAWREAYAQELAAALNPTARLQTSPLTEKA